MKITARSFLRIDGPLFVVTDPTVTTFDGAQIAQGVFKTRHAADNLAFRVGAHAVIRRGRFVTETTIETID